MLYTHAVIPRLGLGNSLFPWARAEVFRHRFGLPMLGPVWFKPMIGPTLRREVDRRVYWPLFQQDDYTGGLARLTILCSSRRLQEPQNWFAGSEVALPSAGLVVFRGLKPPNSDADYFLPLWGQGDFLRRRLLTICRPSALRGLPAAGGPFIGVHMRRGDLRQSLSDPHNAIYCPPAWFIATLRSLQDCGELCDLPVRVMTDGGAEDRALFAGLRGVEFVDAGNALANILCLARATVFVGTGYSTFSRWISFLGGMPTLYYPGYVPPAVGHAAYSGGYDPQAAPPAGLREQIVLRRGAAV